MEKEIRALQAEVATLRAQIGKDEVKMEKKSLKSIKTEIEEEYPTKVTMETDPDQDDRIIDILKLMDEENAMKQKKISGELENKREAEAKFVASEKAKADVAKRIKADADEAEKVRAAKEADEKRLATEAAAAAAAAAIKLESKTVDKGAEVTKPKAAVAKKASTKKTSKSDTETPSDVKKKSATKLATKKAATKSATTSNADDWATLAESTLKRKSVAQLTEYLVGRVS
jgi:hypothetical protein